MTEPNVKVDQLNLTEHYHFDLPKDYIAQRPLENREDAKLMVVNRTTNRIDHCHVRNLDEVLAAGDCLVLNDTKVIPAKLAGLRTNTCGRWHGLFLQADDSGNWRVLCKTRGNLKPGETVTLQDRVGNEAILLDMVLKMDDGSWIVKPQSEGTAEELLTQVGRVPLPNYIRGGNMVDADVENYQTIFAKNPGAVAAPTAGLHLTKPLIHRLIDTGINITNLTLHVGIGTFRPVAADQLQEHKMHSEWGQIEQKAIDKIDEARSRGKRVVAVGTTSVRVLETAANQSENNVLQPWSGETDLFIRPPYKFKQVDAMMTNFHLPRSTLLVLVRTFGGDELLKRAYEEAIIEQYRFYSYGDAMIIID